MPGAEPAAIVAAVRPEDVAQVVDAMVHRTDVLIREAADELFAENVLSVGIAPITTWGFAALRFRIARLYVAAWAKEVSKR